MPNFSQWYILENIAFNVGKIHYSPTVFTKEPFQSQAREIAREPKWLKKEKETYMPAFTIGPQSDEKVLLVTTSAKNIKC